MNMKYFTIYLLVSFLGIVCSPMEAKKSPQILKSPDGQLEIKIWTEEQLSYAIFHNEQLLLDKSPVGLVLENRTLGNTVEIDRIRKRSEVKESIVSPMSRLSFVLDTSPYRPQLNVKRSFFGRRTRINEKGVLPPQTCVNF